MSALHAGDVGRLVSVDVSNPTTEVVPVLPALGTVLPGMRRGQVVVVDAGMTMLWTLLAGGSAAGLWCAVVGVPELGVEAATGLGVAVDRVVVIPDPGVEWASVVGVLVGAFDVVLVRPPVRVTGSVARRLEALARRHRSVLVVAGEWEGAQTRLRTTSPVWTGPQAGRGYLRGRRVRVEVSGRGASARPRSAWLWLPGPDGAASTAELEVVEMPA